MISCCWPRKLEYPQTRCRTSSALTRAILERRSLLAEVDARPPVRPGVEQHERTRRMVDLGLGESARGVRRQIAAGDRDHLVNRWGPVGLDDRGFHRHIPVGEVRF